MSTKADRRHRAERRILPVKVQVRQTDGSKRTQIVDADVRVRKPAHEPGTEWSRAEVEALLAEHERPVDAARAAGISRERVRQLMERFGLAAPVCDPRAQPVNQRREKALVTVSLRADQHEWLNAHGRGQRSALVQKGVDYLMAPDRAAWLAEHEEPDVLARAAKRAKS